MLLSHYDTGMVVKLAEWTIAMLVEICGERSVALTFSFVLCLWLVAHGLTHSLATVLRVATTHHIISLEMLAKS